MSLISLLTRNDSYILPGLGTWMILGRMTAEELSPFTTLIHAIRPLLDPLSRLAARTHVLHWAQSR